MNVSDVKIRKTFPEGNLKAIVSITIDNCLAVHEIKIVQGNDRLFAAMPSRKDENGIYRDIIHPIDPETRDEFDKIILSAYERYVALEKIMNDEEVTEYGISCVYVPNRLQSRFRYGNGTVKQHFQKKG